VAATGHCLSAVGYDAAGSPWGGGAYANGDACARGGAYGGHDERKRAATPDRKPSGSYRDGGGGACDGRGGAATVRAAASRSPLLPSSPGGSLGVPVAMLSGMQHGAPPPQSTRGRCRGSPA